MLKYLVHLCTTHPISGQEEMGMIHPLSIDKETLLPLPDHKDNKASHAFSKTK